MSMEYFLHGIITSGEAKNYIGGANAIIQGDPGKSFFGNPFYCTYKIWVAINLFFGNIYSTVCLQCLLNITAAFCIYKIITTLTTNSRHGKVGFIFFLFLYVIQSWTLTLYSDNFFVCMIVFSFYFTLLPNKNWKLYVVIAIILLLTFFTRPPSFLFVLPCFWYCITELGLLKSKRSITVLIVGYITYFLALFFLSVNCAGIVYPVACSVVIGDDKQNYVSDFNFSTCSLYMAYCYLYTKFGIGYILLLFVKKLLVLFQLTRRYNSTLHNILLMSSYFIYPLSVLGLYNLNNNKKKKVFLLFIAPLVAYCILIGLTYNEWHERFSLPLFPLLIILGCIGLHGLKYQDQLKRRGQFYTRINLSNFYFFQ